MMPLHLTPTRIHRVHNTLSRHSYFQKLCHNRDYKFQCPNGSVIEVSKLVVLVTESLLEQEIDPMTCKHEVTLKTAYSLITAMNKATELIERVQSGDWVDTLRNKLSATQAQQQQAEREVERLKNECHRLQTAIQVVEKIDNPAPPPPPPISPAPALPLPPAAEKLTASEKRFFRNRIRSKRTPTPDPEPPPPPPPPPKSSDELCKLEKYFGIIATILPLTTQRSEVARKAHLDARLVSYMMRVLSLLPKLGKEVLNPTGIEKCRVLAFEKGEFTLTDFGKTLLADANATTCYIQALVNHLKWPKGYSHGSVAHAYAIAEEQIGK